MRLPFWPTRDRRIALLEERNRTLREDRIKLQEQHKRLVNANKTLGQLNRSYQAIADQTAVERDAARAERDLLREVAIKAQAWHKAMAEAPDGGIEVSDPAVWRACEELCAAVDALPKVPTQRDGSDA